MSIWLFLWLILSCILLYFSVWSFYLLRSQKKAWIAFAKKYDLRCEEGGFFDAAHVKGMYKDFAIALFTGEHRREDARNSRKLTAIEVEMQSKMPMAAAAASGGMIDVLDFLNHSNEYKPKHKKWKSEYVIRTEDIGMMKAYLTDERVEALTGLMAAVNAWVIFIFQEGGTLLRLDIASPMHDTKKIEVMLNKMVEVAKLLELADGENIRLEKHRNQKDSGDGTLAVDPDALGDEIGLELEEEDKTEASEGIVEEPTDDDKPEAEKSK